ncbi:MAG: hypothetical protein ACI9WC_002193 [Arenicella sp.]|jgi:hypothetical protein
MAKALNVLPIKKGLVSIAIITLVPCIAWADKTDDIVNSGLARAKAGASSQKKIDDIAEATDKVVSLYHQQRKVVEGLNVYNDRLRRTLQAQKEAMGKLEQSIDDASLIERQIVPLMMRMIVGLDKFIEADLPFKKVERLARIERIRGYLTNANISAAERFRQVLEAYKQEGAYGKTLSVYTETLSLADGELTVNVLQVGRTGLYYQTLDSKVSGYWNKSESAWKTLDSSYNDGISQAIRITQGKEIDNLMRLPIEAPLVAGTQQ